MKKLTIQEQIDVLNETKRHLDEFCYVCVKAWHLTKLKLNMPSNQSLSFNSDEVRNYIPLLTFENAQIACRKGHVKMPVERSNGGWWRTFAYGEDNRKSRRVFINWVINELKKQL